MSNNPVLLSIGPGSTKTSATLYTRMGGEEKLDAVVDHVYKAMLKDKEIGKQFARFRLERLKDRTVDYLRGEFGGDGYKGPDLWISHSHLGVNNHWYDIMMKYYVKALKVHRIGKQESKEILESLENMRKPIVDPGQKFKEMYLKYTAKEAAKAGGDGWSTLSKKEREKQDREKAAAQKAPPAAETGLPRPGPAAPLPPPRESQKASTASTVSTPRQPQGRDVAFPDHHLFDFSPSEDSLPPPIPSSRPSGAEQLYRLSVPGRAPRCSAAALHSAA